MLNTREIIKAINSPVNEMYFISQILNSSLILLVNKLLVGIINAALTKKSIVESIIATTTIPSISHSIRDNNYLSITKKLPRANKIKIRYCYDHYKKIQT